MKYLKFKMPRPIPLVTICCLFVAWVVLLGGTAAMADKDRIFSSDVMRPLWWGCFFQLFVSCFYTFALFTDTDGEWAIVIVSMTGMVATYLMISTNFFITCDTYDSCKAAAAGGIICCIVDMVIMILYGNEKFRQKLYDGVDRVRAATIQQDDTVKPL